MGEQRVHKGREVELWVRDHRDIPLTIEEVSAGVGWSAASTSSTLGRMVERYPEHMERIGRGVYRWNTAARVTMPDVSESDMIVEGTKFVAEVVLAAPNGSVVLKFGDQLYRLVPIEL